MNNQNKHYQQLTQEPRYQFFRLRKALISLRAIAQEVGVHFSTVSRELSRNATEGNYSFALDHQMSWTRSQTASKAHKHRAKTHDIGLSLKERGYKNYQYKKDIPNYFGMPQ